MRFPSGAFGTSPRWSDYEAEGFNTAFRFPFKSSVDSERRAAVADLLLGLPLTTVLFLKHLEEIDVRIEQDGRHEQRTWTVAARASGRGRGQRGRRPMASAARARTA